MKISFEIVPRNAESVQEQITFIQDNLSFINTINVPDLLRMPIRSWQVSEYIDRKKYDFIPHIRGIDFDLSGTRLQNILDQYGFDRILLVSGDPPPNMSHRVYDTNILELIAQVRKNNPDITIYAGFDPYRSSIKDERNYMLSKLEHGADFLLSQPFFDFRLLEIYSELIPHEKIFWGISPVVSDKSMSYWQRVNNAVFPKTFVADYDWNIQFALDVISYAKAHKSHVYFMPISIDLKKYFSPIVQSLQTA